MLCRFTGAVREFYSVAQHCVLVSHLVPDHLRMHGLLHDASEAYVNDLNSHLKHAPGMGTYRSIEGNWERTIAKVFNIQWCDEIHRQVKEADDCAFRQERQVLFGQHQKLFNPLLPQQAEQFFLQRFNTLVEAGL